MTVCFLVTGIDLCDDVCKERNGIFIGNSSRDKNKAASKQNDFTAKLTERPGFLDMVLVKSSRVGVAGGGGGVMAVEEEKVCSVAWQRQHVHHQQRSTRAGIKMAAQGGEALPVVELRPFTKRVWRREKSLPTFSKQPRATGDTGTESSRNGAAPPAPHFRQFVHELRDQRRKKDVSGRLSVDSYHRLPLKLHPKAEFSFGGDTLAEHRQDLIPSFVSRQGRSKSTLGEDGGMLIPSRSVVIGGSNNSGEESADGLGVHDLPAGLVRESSNLMAAFTRDKPLHQQNVCVMGDKIAVSHPGRRHLAYLSPFPLYREKRAWRTTRLENSPTPLSPRQPVSISFLARDGRSFPAVSRDHPSTQDLVLAGSLLHNVRRMQPPSSSTHRQTNPHKFHQKLGAAQDSFMALSKSGAPTIVEQNISYDLEVRLERCRRERSFAAVSEFNALSASQHLCYDSQPTPGEAVLMKARQANKSQDRRRVVHRKNGLDRSLGAFLPSFLQQQHVFRGGVEDSPVSNKSQHGGSESSSPGEPAEDTARLADSSRPLSQNMTPMDLQLPVRNETRKISAKESHRVAFLDSIPVDNAEDADSLVESTDEYQRPLSDTAATETIHVRNDQTPMSADNRARLLPRYDAYLEVIQSSREQTAQRPRTENSSKDLSFLRDTAVDHGAPRAIWMVSDAEAVNTGADMGISSSPGQSALASMPGGPAPLKKESQRNDAHQRRQQSADSFSAKVSPSDPTHSVDLNKNLTVEESQQSELNQVNAHSQISSKTDEHHKEETKNPELLSAGSDKPSTVRSGNRKDTDEQSPSSESVAQESPTKEDKGSAPHPNGTQNVLGVSDNTSEGSGIPLNTVKNNQTTPDCHGLMMTSDRPAQETLEDAQVNDNVSKDNEVVMSTSSMDNTKSMRSEQKSTNEKSVTEFSDINATLDKVLDADHTVAGNTIPRDDDHKEDPVSTQMVENQATIKASSSTESLRSLSQPRRSQSSERPVSTERPGSSTVKPESNIGVRISSGSGKSGSANDDNANDSSASTNNADNNDVTSDSSKENKESDAQRGVETMVTVTMDAEEYDDAYDASKTFLTTANVDDWKDMVAV
ncbi:hypothetical protein ACOMHN_045944 [Nucella lapillus]